MKFFEIVPRELFSPLASPNRELYVDALDVLYTAYRENLKIRDDTLYSMLRSRLEQQLADATFEGEDIDEEELCDVSGRARFLIRKLCSKGGPKLQQPPAGAISSVTGRQPRSWIFLCVRHVFGFKGCARKRKCLRQDGGHIQRL